jgi:hypothetical protein
MRCRLPVGFPATETVEDFLQFIAARHYQTNADRAKIEK